MVREGHSPGSGLPEGPQPTLAFLSPELGNSQEARELGVRWRRREDQIDGG